jgi:predicted acyl esterase
MSDGTRLAAKIWLPRDARVNPVPAVLEYIPYRKRDTTSERDALNHPYFAGHGYASVRVDIRGSGDSEGILTDEYLKQEQDDGIEILKWLSAQPWCDGNVGIIGISWGGFNGLQIAARRPPELKAVISVCSTDDRYADDVHYMGGTLLGDNLSWASVMFAFNSCPPDPEIVGDKWRKMWMERLEKSGLWLDRWLRHQIRDDYWKHGSICEDFSAVQCPVMAVSGWADGYTNAVFRLLEKLEAPRLGLVGPWSHKYPHMGKPGPAIGFLQECVRWWDQWLKGQETGIMERPMLRAWMQDSVPPTTSYKTRPGKWVTENRWPSPLIGEQVFRLVRDRIVPFEQEFPEEELSIRSPLSVGLFAGKWCSYSAPPDLPHDQREEDGGALTFDSDPLREDLEILGAPAVELEFSSSKPVAMVAVRLSDVAPDDKATRVTYGLLNLTHRNSHETPSYLEPGKRYRVRVKLNDIGQIFPKSHRIRISLSTSYWPLAWPPPQPVKLTVYGNSSHLILPVRSPREEDKQVSFEEPEAASTLETSLLETEDHHWKVIRDLANDLSTLEVVNDEGVYKLKDIDLEVERRTWEWYTFYDDDFTSPEGKVVSIRGFKRKGWDIRTRTRTILSCDENNFYIQAELDAFEGENRVYSRNWSRSIPRDFV